MAGKPTLKTIAQLSGLAVPTVSRALGDAPDISAATKQKVKRIAQKIGYVPNRAGIRLRTGRTGVISIVMSTNHEMMDLTARLISCIALALRDTGYHLNVTPYLAGDDRMKPVRQIVESGSADALILNQIEPDDTRIDYLLDRKFPFVTHGRSSRAQEHGYFDFDNRAFAKIAVEQLVGRGRRRILLIAPPQSESYAAEMIAGAREAADSGNAELVLAETISSDSGIAAIRRGVAALVSDDPAIDGLLVGAPVAAMAAVAGFEACGRTVGHDFDVVAKDAVSILNLFRAPIMVVEEDVDQAGRFLARAALHAILKPDEPPMQQVDGDVVCSSGDRKG